jgi:hypothetical protein
MPVRIDGVNSAIVAWCRFGEAMELTPEALETCEEEWYLRDASLGLTYCSIAPMNRIVPATPVSDTAIECIAPPLPIRDVDEESEENSGRLAGKTEAPLMDPVATVYLATADQTAWHHARVAVVYEALVSIAEVAPSRGNLRGGTEVVISTSAPWLDGRIPFRHDCACRFGSAIVTASCNYTTAAVHCKTPSQRRVGRVPVAVSVNGGFSWTTEKVYFEYVSIKIRKLAASLTSAGGGGIVEVLGIRGCCFTEVFSLRRKVISSITSDLLQHLLMLMFRFLKTGVPSGKNLTKLLLDGSSSIIFTTIASTIVSKKCINVHTKAGMGHSEEANSDTAKSPH